MPFGYVDEDIKVHLFHEHHLILTLLLVNKGFVDNGFGPEGFSPKGFKILLQIRVCICLKRLWILKYGSNSADTNWDQS